jgi:hypothetical protein
MTYGNNGNGYSYSPDRRYDVDHYNNNRTQFLGANGNRSNGYYYSSSAYYTSKPATCGWYDGSGRYHAN